MRMTNRSVVGGGDVSQSPLANDAEVGDVVGLRGKQWAAVLARPASLSDAHDAVFLETPRPEDMPFFQVALERLGWCAGQDPGLRVDASLLGIAVKRSPVVLPGGATLGFSDLPDDVQERILISALSRHAVSEDEHSLVKAVDDAVRDGLTGKPELAKAVRTTFHGDAMARVVLGPEFELPCAWPHPEGYGSGNAAWLVYNKANPKGPWTSNDIAAVAANIRQELWSEANREAVVEALRAPIHEVLQGLGDDLGPHGFDEPKPVVVVDGESACAFRMDVVGEDGFEVQAVVEVLDSYSDSKQGGGFAIQAFLTGDGGEQAIKEAHLQRPEWEIVWTHDIEALKKSLVGCMAGWGEAAAQHVAERTAWKEALRAWADERELGPLLRDAVWHYYKGDTADNLLGNSDVYQRGWTKRREAPEQLHLLLSPYLLDREMAWLAAIQTADGARGFMDDMEKDLGKRIQAILGEV